jgi:hypothetical protein
LLPTAGLVVYADPDVTTTPSPSVTPPLMIPIFARYVVDTLPDDAVNDGVMVVGEAVKENPVGGGGREDTVGPVTALYVPNPSEFEPATEM